MNSIGRERTMGAIIKYRLFLSFCLVVITVFSAFSVWGSSIKVSDFVKSRILQEDRETVTCYIAGNCGVGLNQEVFEQQIRAMLVFSGFSGENFSSCLESVLKQEKTLGSLYLENQNSILQNKCTGLTEEEKTDIRKMMKDHRYSFVHALEECVARKIKRALEVEEREIALFLLLNGKTVDFICLHVSEITKNYMMLRKKNILNQASHYFPIAAAIVREGIDESESLARFMQNNQSEYPIFEEYFTNRDSFAFYQKIANKMLRDNGYTYTEIKDFYSKGQQQGAEQIIKDLAGFLLPSPCDDIDTDEEDTDEEGEGLCSCDEDCTRPKMRIEIWEQMFGELGSIKATSNEMYRFDWFYYNHDADPRTNFLKAISAFLYQKLKIEQKQGQVFFSEDPELETAYFHKLAEIHLEDASSYKDAMKNLELIINDATFRYQRQYPYLTLKQAEEVAFADILINQPTISNVTLEIVQNDPIMSKKSDEYKTGFARYFMHSGQKTLSAAYQGMQESIAKKVDALPRGVIDLLKNKAVQMVENEMIEGIAVQTSLTRYLKSHFEAQNQDAGRSILFYADLSRILLNTSVNLTIEQGVCKIDEKHLLRHFHKEGILLPDNILIELATECVRNKKKEKEEQIDVLAHLLKDKGIVDFLKDQLLEVARLILERKMMIEEATQYTTIKELSLQFMKETDDDQFRDQFVTGALLLDVTGNVDERIKIFKQHYENFHTVTEQWVTRLSQRAEKCAPNVGLFLKNFRELDFLFLALHPQFSENELELPERCMALWQRFHHHALMLRPDLENSLDIKKEDFKYTVYGDIATYNNENPFTLDVEDLIKLYRRTANILSNSSLRVMEAQKKEFRERKEMQKQFVQKASKTLHNTCQQSTRFKKHFLDYEFEINKFCGNRQNDSLQICQEALRYDPYIRFVSLDHEAPEQVSVKEIAQYVIGIHRFIDLNSIETLQLEAIFGGEEVKDRRKWKQFAKNSITKMVSWFVEFDRSGRHGSRIPESVGREDFFMPIYYMDIPEPSVRKIMRRKFKRCFQHILKLIEAQEIETAIQLILPAFYQGNGCINPAYDWVEQMMFTIDGESCNEYSLFEKISYVLRRQRINYAENVGAERAVILNDDGNYTPEYRRFMANISALPLSFGFEPVEVMHSADIYGADAQEQSKNHGLFKEDMRKVLGYITPENYIEAVYHAICNESPVTKQSNKIYCDEIMLWAENSPWYCNHSNDELMELLAQEQGRREISERMMIAAGYLKRQDDQYYDY